jgi:hypothetical protein
MLFRIEGGMDRAELHERGLQRVVANRRFRAIH